MMKQEGVCYNCVYCKRSIYFNGFNCAYIEKLIGEECTTTQACEHFFSFFDAAKTIKAIQESTK